MDWSCSDQMLLKGGNAVTNLQTSANSEVDLPTADVQQTQTRLTVRAVQRLGGVGNAWQRSSVQRELKTLEVHAEESCC